VSNQGYGGTGTAGTNTAAHTLILSATDTGFTFPQPSSPGGDTIHTTASSTVTNTNSATATTLTFLGEVDTANAEFGDSMDTSPGIQMSYAAHQGNSSSGDLSLDKNGFDPGSNPYSITAVYTMGIGYRGNVISAGGAVEVMAPEPGTWALALTGVFSLGGGHWLRRRLKRR